jgi:hypothetical protein
MPEGELKARPEKEIVAGKEHPTTRPRKSQVGKLLQAADIQSTPSNLKKLAIKDDIPYFSWRLGMGISRVSWWAACSQYQ